MIYFNKPFVGDNEKKYVNDALERGSLCGDKFYTKLCHEFIQQKFYAQKALLTTSCSMALDMTCLLLDLQKDDEVIIPSFNFVSMANSIMLRGAIPIFAEVCEDTLNIDPRDIENKITSRTKAIFPVHYAGVACDMDKIMDIANRHGLKVIEDAAQGVNAKYKDKYLGTIGDMGCYSFHESKNFSCGEGGALLINGDERLSLRAEIIREKGTNRSQFIRGEVDKYTWIDIGSSYLPSDILAGLLLSQLEHINEITQKRKQIYESYSEGLLPLQQRGFLKLPVIPKYATSNYHIFYILLENNEVRDRLLDYLNIQEVKATFHYVPLHSSPVGRTLGNKECNLPLTQNLSGRLLRLPLHCNILADDINYIVDIIIRFFN